MKWISPVFLLLFSLSLQANLQNRMLKRLAGDLRQKMQQHRDHYQWSKRGPSLWLGDFSKIVCEGRPYLEFGFENIEKNVFRFQLPICGSGDAIFFLEKPSFKAPKNLRELLSFKWLAELGDSDFQFSSAALGVFILKKENSLELRFVDPYVDTVFRCKETKKKGKLFEERCFVSSGLDSGTLRIGHYPRGKYHHWVDMELPQAIFLQKFDTAVDVYIVNRFHFALSRFGFIHILPEGF